MGKRDCKIGKERYNKSFTLIVTVSKGPIYFLTVSGLAKGIVDLKVYLVETSNSTK